LDGSDVAPNSSTAAQLNRELGEVQRQIAEATLRWDALAAEHSVEEDAATV
jgi:formate-dependent nitrite reductase cytochrome c552 subunit